MDIREIRYGDYTARINLSRGANCISLRHKALSAKILREPSYDRPLDNPYLYGMPILFPVNRISGAGFSFEGRTYTFPMNEPKTGCHLHGVLHEMPFNLVRQDESSLTATYHANQFEYLGFPHEFEISIEYSLSESGMLQKTKVTNLSDENMPCLLGFHTTFNSLPTKNSKASRVFAELDCEYERNMENYLPTGVKPEPDMITLALKEGGFDPLSTPISRHYKSIGGRLAIYADDISVVYENCEELPFRLIYNGAADEYICLEPQTSLANSPNSPIPRDEAGFSYIPAHESRVYTSRVRITKNI